MSKILKISNVEGQYLINCPGCKSIHSFFAKPFANPINGASWDFNDNFEFPTLYPSLLLNYEDGSGRCHSYIKEGKIQFLDDCTHELKNQIVELLDFED